MHLDDEQIQRLLHGQLDGPAEQALRGHLETCGGCRAQLEEAEREEERVFDLLRRLDHAAPAVSADALALRGAHPRWARWAAGVLLALLAAGAAYAAPGSPLPAWVDRLGEWVAGPEAPATEPGTAGVAIEPGDRFTVVFTTPPMEGVVVVTLTDGRTIVARSVSGRATFTTDVDRLTIEHGGPAAEYDVELPRRAPWVEIWVGQRRLLLKEASRIVTDGPVDSLGRYRIPLGAAAR